MEHRGTTVAAFYTDSHVVPIQSAIGRYAESHDANIPISDTDDVLSLAGPDSHCRDTLLAVHDWCVAMPDDELANLGVPTGSARLKVPVATAPKLFLLAGNYADHITEDGSPYEERDDTFPYVFMKPPSTTLLDPARPFRLPASAPESMDWEVELAVVMGRRIRNATEAEALDAVAGYTVLNDLSDRHFRPNPNRRERDWDKFFDWMHGKWHDASAPCGPCLATPETVPDPQDLRLRLSLNGDTYQDGGTDDQVFPVAAVIAFISGFATLEPGDIISTGTPAGVGHTTRRYLRDGDVIEASISSIGTLTTRVRGPSG